MAPEGLQWVNWGIIVLKQKLRWRNVNHGAIICSSLSLYIPELNMAEVVSFMDATILFFVFFFTNADDESEIPRLLKKRQKPF